jgi:tRNA-dihydrouridine synthase B
MLDFIKTPFRIGTLPLAHRLIQGPLAGFSCAPFRTLFYDFLPPAYCVTEMISAFDVVNKHASLSRYLYRDPREKTLCYQISGTDAQVMSQAAQRLQDSGADLIDINCGCPKTKIRKKGAGSALMDSPQTLLRLVETLRRTLTIPLTVKLRIKGDSSDFSLAKALESAGADALIVHGRKWTDDYEVPCNLAHLAPIKQAVSIPVIANGDIHDRQSLERTIAQTGCDAFMIGRAGTGKPWLYQSLLNPVSAPPVSQQIALFCSHLRGLQALEGEYKALLQSKSLVRYYFGSKLSRQALQIAYQFQTVAEFEHQLPTLLT